MKTKENRNAYRGIIPPMVTPLTGRDTLDVAGLERLVEHLVAGGVSGLFLLGTTGEAPGLSYRLRRELIDRTCALVGGRVRVLVGITDTSLVESLALAAHAESAGADAVVASAPFYFPAGQPELREYCDRLAAGLSLPLFLYNMPALTKVSFDLETVEHACQLPGIAGLKDSSGDMVYFHKVTKLASENRPDWSVLMGPEELLADAVLAGGHGGVCGGANLFPRLYVHLYQAAVSGDVTSVQALSSQVLEISSRLYTIGNHASAFIKSVKCGLSLLGVCDDFMADPFHRFHADGREEVREVIESLELGKGNRVLTGV